MQTDNSVCIMSFQLPRSNHFIYYSHRFLTTSIIITTNDGSLSVIFVAMSVFAINSLTHPVGLIHHHSISCTHQLAYANSPISVSITPSPFHTLIKNLKPNILQILLTTDCSFPQVCLHQPELASHLLRYSILSFFIFPVIVPSGRLRWLPTSLLIYITQFILITIIKKHYRN